MQEIDAFLSTIQSELASVASDRASQQAFRLRLGDLLASLPSLHDPFFYATSRDETRSYILDPGAGRALNATDV